MPTTFVLHTLQIFSRLFNLHKLLTFLDENSIVCKELVVTFSVLAHLVKEETDDSVLDNSA